MAVLSLISHALPGSVTPRRAKVPVVTLVLLAGALALVLYRAELSRRPLVDAPFAMWLLPGLSGQLPLPSARWGDRLQKAFGLGYVDLSLGV